ncbi:hypothetical protein MTO96_024910 [Rhipicephalus appendiculatus]
MVLWVIAIAAVLGTTIYFGVYKQQWPLAALGIGQRRWDDDFYGAPQLIAHKREPLHAQTDPVFERVRAATERIDTERYERVSKALQVVYQIPDNIPTDAHVILLPLLLAVILRWCCRPKEGRPTSASSFCSETPVRGPLTENDLSGDRLPRTSEPGGRMRRSRQVRHRRSSLEHLDVEFPALLSDAEASTAERHNSYRAEEATTVGAVQQWLRGVALQHPSQGRRPTELLAGRISDVLGSRVGRDGPLRSRSGWSRGAAASDRVRATDGNDVRSDLAERLQDGAGSASEDDAEEIAVFGDYDDEGKPLLELSDDSSGCEGSNGEERHSGRGDGDRSDMNTSGLSEETAYMDLPKSERSSATASICSLDVATQDAWFSATATFDPLVATPALRPNPPQRPRNMFEELLEACRQQEPVSFSTVLKQLGVENCVKLHESENADIFLVSTVRGDTMVLKVYDCAHIGKHLCCVINEIRIGWSLTMLANGLENQTGGFPRVHMARCTWDSYPPLLDTACCSYLKRRGSADFRDYGRKLYSPYAVICMESAGEPLSKMALGVFDSPLQVRSVIQQVALALAVAEAELEFEHRALTPGHVLLKPARRRVAHYRLMNNALSIELHGWEACVVDFAASRMTPGEGGMPIYIGLHELPDDKRSALGKRLDLVKQIVRPNASRFSPYTNVIFLHDLVHGLRKTYKQIFAYDMPHWADAERKAWEDVSLWADEMASSRSARDFVIARVLTSATFVD